MRLLVSTKAFADLERIAERAPRQALRLITAIERLTERPFAGMHRRVEGRPGEHALSEPPHVVFYTVQGDDVTVLSIEDSRQHWEPW